MAQTPIALTRLAAERLRDARIENARLEAELLLGAVLGLRRLDLYLQHDRPLKPAELAAYRAAVRRRLRREPLQYITGETQFRQLALRVDPRVLIPRPETEVLVGEVLRWAERKEECAAPTLPRGPEPGVGGESTSAELNTPGARSNRKGRGDDRGSLTAREGRGTLRALDVGTGSGAIALSLAREGPFVRVVATDVSADALDLAAENAARLGLAGRVELRPGPLLDATGARERFDVVVSNPPYVAESERTTLPPEVRDWEPATALFAPGGGLDVLMALVRDAPAHLRPGGLLALEVGLGQANTIAREADESGAYGSVRIVRDLTGRDRIVLAVARPLARTNQKGEHA